MPSESKQRDSDNELLKEASHFQFIFENSNEGIIRFSMDGEVRQANASAARILGYESIDRLKKSVGYCMASLAFINPDDHDRMFSEFRQKGQLVNAEIAFVREVDNESALALCTMRAIAAEEGQEPCVLASFVDMGDRLENERLKLASQAAEAASQAKSQFLANMSHEIRTPLNGVTGMLELLSRTELESHQTRYIEIAQNSAKSLLSVINDILDFSKIEAGKLELDEVDFPLRETLADVVDIFASQTAAKKIELIGHIPPDLPDWVSGDPERIRQVLINILGNAVKFTDSGTISLTVVCKERVNDAAVLQLIIKDSGCGMSEKSLSKLFESFTQADSSTTRKYGGTGLGLTISRQLISLMNGEISVTSEVGVGSEVTIDLTLPVSDKVSEYRSTLPPSLSGMRVLVVDDHPVNLELSRELLKPFGLEVDCAESAADALELHEQAVAQNKPYELFLLDYHMPSMDGAELADRLRQTDAGAKAKLILLTSIDQVRPNDPGMSNFDTLLVKPVRASRLFDSIATVMVDRLLPVKTASKEREDEPAGMSSTSTANTRILLVEDNIVNQIVASEILTQAGYQVETADNGQEAVDKLGVEQFDIVLMDCQMPVLDGFEASQVIREAEAVRGVTDAMPIIALTANALKGDRERCLEAGMNDYITKPINANELYALLAKYVVADDVVSQQRTGT